MQAIDTMMSQILGAKTDVKCATVIGPPVVTEKTNTETNCDYNLDIAILQLWIYFL